MTIKVETRSDTSMDRPSTYWSTAITKALTRSLRKNLTYRQLEDDFEVYLEWLPYTLDIPSYLGSARLDERGQVVE